MKKSEITSLSIEDLKIKIQEETKNYQSKRYTHKVTPLENPISLRADRKSIARLNTELTKKLSQG